MTKANAVLAVAAGIFGVGCLVLFRGLSSERTRVHALEAQLAQLQRDVKPPEPADSDNGTALASEPAQTAPMQPAAASSTSTASTSTTNKPVAAKDTAERDRQRRVLADPSYRAAARVEERLQLRSEYPQLAAELGLSKEEGDRFLDLLSEQSLRESESATKEQPGEDVQRRRRKLFEQQEQERREFLGEQRFQLWTEYVNSAGARGLVSQLQTQLATSTSPLREEQIKPLVKALAAEQQRHWAERQENYSASAQQTEETPVADRVAYMERRAELVEQSVARSREAGAMYLDSTQQRILNAMLETQSERARAEVASFRAFWEAEKRAR
jgi:hypothetical protein